MDAARFCRELQACGIKRLGSEQREANQKESAFGYIANVTHNDDTGRDGIR